MTDWQPIETAPKDGTRVLLGGRFRPSYPNTGGQWTCEIFSWSTLSSNLSTADYYWIGSDFNGLEHWNVDWTHWHSLPEPPND